MLMLQERVARTTEVKTKASNNNATNGDNAKNTAA